MTKQKDKAKAGGKDLGKDQVKEQVDQENAAGLAGVEVDPTPNENYSVAGVAEGAPTPETDPEAAKEAREAAGLNPAQLPESVKPGDMVKVKTPDGRTIEMSRKAYELASDKFTLVGK